MKASSKPLHVDSCFTNEKFGYDFVLQRVMWVHTVLIAPCYVQTVPQIQLVTDLMGYVRQVVSLGGKAYHVIHVRRFLTIQNFVSKTRIISLF